MWTQYQKLIVTRLPHYLPHPRGIISTHMVATTCHRIWATYPPTATQAQTRRALWVALLTVLIVGWVDFLAVVVWLVQVATIVQGLCTVDLEVSYRPRIFFTSIRPMLYGLLVCVCKMVVLSAFLSVAVNTCLLSFASFWEKKINCTLVPILLTVLHLRKLMLLVLHSVSENWSFNCRPLLVLLFFNS